jgi:predicted RNase H-like nuclease
VPDQGAWAGVQGHQVGGDDPSLAEWADVSAAIPVPKKADQDRLDGVLCTLIGFH